MAAPCSERLTKGMKTTKHPCQACGQRGRIIKPNFRLAARLTALGLCVLPVVALGVGYANAPELSRVLGFRVTLVPGWAWGIAILGWCLIVEYAGKVAEDDFVAQEQCPICHGAGSIIRITRSQPDGPKQAVKCASSRS